MKYKSKAARGSIIEETPLTMVELRKNSGQVMRGLKKGLRYRLSYRGKTVGLLCPPEPENISIPPDDPIFHLDDYAGDGPVGSLKNEEIDRRIYGL